MARAARATRKQSKTPASPRSVAAASIAVLIGASLSLLCTGFVESFYQVMDFTPLTFRMAVAAALFSMALGPRLPRKAALVIARAACLPLTRRLAGQRRRGAAASEVISEPPKRALGDTDQELLWTATGVVGLAAGVGALLLVPIISLVRRLWEWGLGEFLWMHWPLTVFEGLMLLLAAVVPFALLGFFMRCVHQLFFPVGRWSVSALGWSLGGVGLGLAGIAWLAGFPPRGMLLLRAGAVPLLVAAMISVCKASPVSCRRSPQERNLVEEPDVGERWSKALLVAVAACVCASLSAGLVWAYVVGTVHGGSYQAMLLAGGAMALAAALGMEVAVRRAPFAEHEIGCLGKHCAATGTVLALGVAAFNVVSRASYTPFLDTPGYWLLWLICACLPLGLAGHALGYGNIAVLRRSACRSDVGSRLLGMILFASAVASLGVALPLLELLGSYATLVASALALLATGGILIIHEPDLATRANRVRVVTVFAAVLIMTWLMPLAGKGWLCHRQRPRGRLVESWWLTCEIGSADGPRWLLREGSRGAEGREIAASFPAQVLNWSRLPTGCRVGAVSLLGDSLPLASAGFGGRVDRLLLAPLMWSRLSEVVGSGRGTDYSAPPVAYAHDPALRSLRASAGRYDLLLISLYDMPPALVQRALASSMMDHAFRRLSPDGVMVALLPRRAHLAAEGRALLAGVSQKGAGHAGWTALTIDGSECLVFFCGAGAAGRKNARDWSAFELATLDKMDEPAARGERVVGLPAHRLPRRAVEDIAVAVRR